MRKLVAYVLLLAALASPGIASAQAWLADRATREAAGFKLGDSLVLHPGLGVEGGYDTNPLRYADDISGAGRLRITAYTDLVTRRAQGNAGENVQPPKVSFKLNLAGNYDFYFADDATVDHQDDFGIMAGLGFVLFPAGKFSLMLNADYERSLQPYESTEEYHAWHSIQPGVGVRFAPGGGTLSLELGYRLDVLLYEDNVMAVLNDKMTHNVRFVTSWKILPKTALISRTVFSPVVHIGSSNYNNDSLPVRSYLGIQGLFTPRFGLSLFVGYGASFYEEGDDYDSVVAYSEAMFFITPFANVRVGGQVDFVDSLYSNFYAKYGGYVKYEQMFGARLLTSLKGEVFYRDYSTLTPVADDGTVLGATVSETQRGDLMAGATLLLELRVTDWLSFHASVGYTGDISDFEYTDPDPDGNPNTDDAETMPVKYHEVQVFGGVRAHY